MARLNRGGSALIFTTHVLADVEELCSSLTVLDRGAVRFCGAPAALCRQFGEVSLERAFLRCIRADADAAAVSA